MRSEPGQGRLVNVGSPPTLPSGESGQTEKGESAWSGDASDEFGDQR